MMQNTINTAKYYKLLRNTANYCKELLHATIKVRILHRCSKMMQNIINCEIQQNTAKYCEFTAKNCYMLLYKVSFAQYYAVK